MRALVLALAIAWPVAACSSADKPAAAPSTPPGSRVWTMTVVDGGRTFAAALTLQPVQKVADYPGGAAALQRLCGIALSVTFDPVGDALVRGTFTITNNSRSKASAAVVLEQFQSPPVYPVLTEGSLCKDSNARGLLMRFEDMPGHGRIVKSNFAIVIHGFFSATYPDGVPDVVSDSLISLQVPGSGAENTVLSLSGPGAYQHTLPLVASADAVAYCRRSGRIC